MKKTTKNIQNKFTLDANQKMTLLAVGVVLVFLVSLVLYSNFSHKSKPKQAVDQSNFQEIDYNSYYKRLLDSIQPDKEASKKLFKEVVSEEEVKRQIETDLQAKRQIPMPEVTAKELQLSSQVGKEAIVAYFRSIAPSLKDHWVSIKPITEKSYQPETSSSDLEMALGKTNLFIEALKSVPVPQEMKEFHSAELLAAYSYRNILEQGIAYKKGQLSVPWPEVYKQFVIAEQALDKADAEFLKIDKKYTIGAIALFPKDNYYARVMEFFSTKKANAFLGAGDLVVVTSSIPDQIKDGIKKAFASAYGRYASQFLGSLINTIDKNFKIANYVYYADAVKGQYIGSYLSKYSTQLDQEIVKRFIPQLTCGQNQNENLRPFLQTKAREYLGFNPSSISLDDPNYEAKMVKVGDFLSNPTGWNMYYDQVAQQATSEAEKALDRELTSSGLKSPRDILGNQISASLNVVENSQVAALVASMQLGSVNAENLVSQLASSVLDSLANKFVFNGAVLQEQSVCTPIPVLNPIVPSDPAVYKSPDFNPETPESSSESQKLR